MLQFDYINMKLFKCSYLTVDSMQLALQIQSLQMLLSFLKLFTFHYILELLVGQPLCTDMLVCLCG